MPTYDYRCAKGHRYEKQEPFGSPSEHPCEKCGQVVAKRQLSVPAIAFKGSGFYKTDSRKSGSDSGGSSSSSSSSSSSGGDWDSSADGSDAL